MRAKGENHISFFGYINSLYHYVRNLRILDQVLPSKNITRKQDIGQQKSQLKSQTTGPKDDLFPTNIQYNELKTNIKPCSMEINKLNKIINSDGSISWEINHEAGTNLNSPFLTSTGSTISTHDELSPKFLGQTNTPSPFNIGNGHNHEEKSTEDDDSNSNHSLDLIPDLPHPDFFDLKSNSSQEIDTPQSTTTTNTTTSPLASSSSSSGKKVYICEYCNAEFRIKGYLTRHVKKHAINKAYECPFFNPRSEAKCHPNGGFSRRDTYKTHLKARHFKYPQGTKSQERANTPGKCGMCLKPYKSNEDWVENHIENGECELLPKGYEGRVKNSRRRNYEFPNSIHEEKKNGSISSCEDLSEDHEHESPKNPIQLNGNNNMNNVNNTNMLSHPTSLDLGFGKTYTRPVLVNEYDNNDEFSLDTEQLFLYS